MTEGSKSASDIVFFLGAGASVAAGIPAVGPMTEEFLEKIKKDQSPCGAALEEIMKRLERALARENPPRKLDVELILQTVHRLIAHPKDELSEFFSDGHGLRPEALEQLKGEIEAFIRNKVIRPRGVDYLSPLLDSQWGRPAHIFSVNYDPCIELLCKNLQRRLIDGFTPEWNPRALEAEDSEAVYLYKLHGSVLWYRSEDGWHVKIPIGPNNNSGAKIELYDGKKADPVILYPMAKQPMEAPLLDFAYILKRRLESAKFSIVIGYSFRDDYLAALFRDTFNANPDLHMISIGPDSRKHYKELLARGPSFKHVFEWRVTCLPFPVERILKDFTVKQFPSLSHAIKEWRDCDMRSRMGQDIAWPTQIVPLSEAGEAAISDDLLVGWPRAWQEMEVSGLWKVVFRNYAMAVATRDAELAHSAAEKVYKLLNGINVGLLVDIVYASGLHIGIRLPRLGGRGALESSMQFYELIPSIQLTLEEIHKFMLSTSSRNLRGLLENLRDAFNSVLGFLKSVPETQRMPAQEFRVQICSRLSLKDCETVAKKLSDLESNVAEPPAKSQEKCGACSAEIMQILQRAEIEPLADLAKVVENGVNFLNALKTDPIGKLMADQ